MTISTDDLQFGDLIFFMNHNNAEHVAIYVGKQKDTRFIAHAVSEPHFSVMTTRLKKDFYPYEVFRCKDTYLAALAACRLLSWVRTGLGFSKEKHDSLYANFMDATENCHPKTGGLAQLSQLQNDFPTIFYRYIAMASHPEYPIIPTAKNSEGVQCAETVVMAYNIETLLKSNAVKSVKDLNNKWVSDKTTTDPIAIQNKFHPSDQYWTYFRRANNPNEYEPYGVIPQNGIKDGALPCSLYAWKYENYPSIEEFIKTYPFSLPLDSKLSTPWAIMTFCQNNPLLWQSLGKLEIQNINYPKEELESKKDEWKKYVLRLFHKREQLHEDILEKFREASSTKFQYSPEKKVKTKNLTHSRSKSIITSSAIQPNPTTSFALDFSRLSLTNTSNAPLESPPQILQQANSAFTHLAKKHLSPLRITQDVFKRKYLVRNEGENEETQITEENSAHNESASKRKKVARKLF